MRDARPILHGRDHAPGGADPIPDFPLSSHALIIYSLEGVTIVSSGSLRWYPPMDGELSFVHVAAAVAPTGSGMTIRVNLNGSSLGTVTIAASTHTNTFVPSTLVFTVGDYFTVDVTAVGSTVAGADVVVQLVGTIS